MALAMQYKDAFLFVRVISSALLGFPSFVITREQQGVETKANRQTGLLLRGRFVSVGSLLLAVFCQVSKKPVCHAVSAWTVSTVVHASS